MAAHAKDEAQLNATILKHIRLFEAIHLELQTRQLSLSHDPIKVTPLHVARSFLLSFFFCFLRIWIITIMIMMVFIFCSLLRRRMDASFAFRDGPTLITLRA